MGSSFAEICQKIVESLRDFYDTGAAERLPKDRFPNLIGLPNGKSLLIPDSVAQDISHFSRRWFAQQIGFAGQLASKDIERLGRTAFADALSDIDLSRDPTALSTEILHTVNVRLSARRPADLYFRMLACARPVREDFNWTSLI